MTVMSTVPEGYKALYLIGVNARAKNEHDLRLVLVEMQEINRERLKCIESINDIHQNLLLSSYSCHSCNFTTR
jgi:hypothetical protein